MEQIDSLQIDPFLYDQLIFSRVPGNSVRKGNTFQRMVQEQLDIHM